VFPAAPPRPPPERCGGQTGVITASVDLHCHILPGIDDGARDLGDAVEMARMAQADGIDAICATPHIRHDHDVRIRELPERRAELAAAVRAAGATIAILPGGEVAATALAGLEDDELDAVSLGGGRRWILLEPAPGPLDDRLDASVRELGRRGRRALIAHPERHLAPDLAARLGGLIAGGALVQATAAYLLSDPTRDGMRVLARAGLLHVLASDAHSSRAGRPPATAAALATLADIDPVGAHLEWIARTAPAAIAAGSDVSPPFAVTSAPHAAGPPAGGG
jgi:protein-tyrosine phosphatase